MNSSPPSISLFTSSSLNDVSCSSGAEYLFSSSSSGISISAGSSRIIAPFVTTSGPPPTFAGSDSSLADLKISSSSSSSRSISFSTATTGGVEGAPADVNRSSLMSSIMAGGDAADVKRSSFLSSALTGGGAADLKRSSSSSWLTGGAADGVNISSSSTGFNVAAGAGTS